MVLYHADVTTFAGGYVGVDVFFVVSGFVITRMLHAEQGRSGRLELGRFYLRRIRRILPALAVLTSVVMVSSVLLGSVGAQGRTLGTGAAASLFSANIYLLGVGRGGYFHAAATTNPLLHTWSLSLEEQFYLVFPALMVLISLVARRRRSATLAVVIAAMSAASFALCWAATGGRLPTSRLGTEFAFFMAPTRVWQFGVGALLAIAASRWPTHRGLAEVAGWGGLALIAWSVVSFDPGTAFPGSAAAVPTFGAALAVAGGFHPRSTATRLLANRHLGWIGDRSYSWYLWHWPFIVFAGSLWPGAHAIVLAGAAASLLPAWLSHRFIEGPIRRGPAHPGRTLRLAAVCVLGPVVLAGGLVVVSRSVSSSDRVAAFDRAVGLHADVTRGCFAGRAAFPNPDCAWPAPGRAATTTGAGNLLVGDSNAGQFSEPFIAASHRQGRTATIQTRGVCPFLDLVVVSGGQVDQACRDYVQAMTRAVVRAKPDTVVISNAIDGYLEDDGFAFIDARGRHARTPEAKAAAWTEALTATTDRLRGAGIAVVVVQPIPKFPGWDPHACATLRVLLDERSCSTSKPQAAARERQSRSIRAQRAVARRASPGLALVEPFDDLCPDDPCTARHDGTWWWQDGNHVSIAGALSVTDLFEDALAVARA